MNDWITSKIVRKLDVEKGSVLDIKISFYIQTLLSELEKLLIILLLYTVLGFLYDIVIILGFVMLIRPYTGGTHKNSFFSCLIATIIFCAMPICFAKYIKIHVGVQAFVTMILIMLVWKFGPVTSKYRPMYIGMTLKRMRVMATTMIAVVNIIFVFLDDAYKNEVTILLCMLAIDVVLARWYKIIEKRKE